MNTYPNEIEAFLDWLGEKAKERNLDFNSHVDDRSKIGRYWREPEVAARVRATKKIDKFQTRNTNEELTLLRENDEKEIFDTVLCVTLKLGSGDKYPQGHFYPIRIPTLVSNFFGEEHADGSRQLTLPFDKRIPKNRRDDVEFALQNRDDGEEVGPSGPSPFPDITDNI